MVTKKTTTAGTTGETRAAAPRATAKTATKPAAKPRVAKAKPAVKGVTLDAASPAGAAAPEAGKALTRKQLYDRVRKASGVKGVEVRKVMDAMLEELGAALVRGESLKLQPLGTLKVQRHKVMGGSDMVVCKLRRKKAAPEGTDPLAEAAE